MCGASQGQADPWSGSDKMSVRGQNLNQVVTSLSLFTFEQIEIRIAMLRLFQNTQMPSRVHPRTWSEQWNIPCLSGWSINWTPKHARYQ